MQLLFVHGALVRDGAWWWAPTGDLLAARTGIRSTALALPSCGETTPEEQSGGLVADAAALRRALDAIDDPEGAIVVGHSYGGTVIAEAGAHPAVRHVVLVSSYLPEVGLSQAGIMSGEADPVAIADLGDGLLGLSAGVGGYDAASFGARFLQDGDPGMQHAAWARVVPQAATAFVTPTTRDGWRGVDTTAIVCIDDRSTSVALQRSHAARATRSVELPTGHHPFLTRPDLVVDVLAEVAGR